jgi:hypothetical protein
MKKLVFVCLLLYTLSQIDPELLKQGQGLSYQALRQKAQEEPAEQIKQTEAERLKKKDDSHLYNQPQEEEDRLEPEAPGQIPTTPSVTSQWFCDPDFKLNSVRDEVMTNKNYNK